MSMPILHEMAISRSNGLTYESFESRNGSIEFTTRELIFTKISGEQGDKNFRFDEYYRCINLMQMVESAHRVAAEVVSRGRSGGAELKEIQNSLREGLRTFKSDTQNKIVVENFFLPIFESRFTPANVSQRFARPSLNCD